MRAPILGWLTLAVLFAGVFLAAPARAADEAPLRVGTKEAPPFVVRRGDGSLDGPSIRLWRELAEGLGVRYTLEERDLPGLLDGVRDGTLDVAVAAITVTSEREATMDFTHPFHTAGLGIVVHKRDRSLWVAVAETLLSRELLHLVGLLGIIQLTVGAVVWLLERRRNPDQFPPRAGAGLFNGFWWSVVTMTTVGYGDKAPRSGAGRIVALAWMLCSVVLIATFTGTVASRMTLRELESEITGPADLERVRLGVLTGATSERWARAHGLNFRRFADLDAALAEAEAGEIDAVVHDGPLLEQALANGRPELELLPARFQRQDYAIALPQGSPLRERLNRLLPEKVRGEPLGDPRLPIGP